MIAYGLVDGIGDDPGGYCTPVLDPRAHTGLVACFEARDQALPSLDWVDSSVLVAGRCHALERDSIDMAGWEAPGRVRAAVLTIPALASEVLSELLAVQS